jgi:hypothetical protein
MKLNRLITLTILATIVGQIFMLNKNNLSSKLERRVKVQTNPPPPKDGDPSVEAFGTNDTKFLILGDTGQIDNYFVDFIKRSKKDPAADSIQELSGGTFKNFNDLIEANQAARYNQAIILGDFIYTENKKGNIEFDPEWKTKDNKTVNEPDFKKKIVYRYNTPKEENGKKVEFQLADEIFKTRVETSATAINTLLKSEKYAKITPFWLLEPGNHSYDIDSNVERKKAGEGKDSVRMYKHSKVHVTAHACFGDLNFGDVVCHNKKDYKDCLGNALFASKYGRNDEQTK